jgi:hypothetical protein
LARKVLCKFSSVAESPAGAELEVALEAGAAEADEVTARSHMRLTIREPVPSLEGAPKTGSANTARKDRKMLASMLPFFRIIV